MTDNTKRNKEIVDLFLGGLIQKDIALMKGITRERVRQILVGELGNKKVAEVVKKNIKQRRDTLNAEKEIIFTCQNCDKEFTAKYIKRRFCSKKCFRAYQKKTSLTKKQRLEKKRAFMRNYYHTRLKLSK